MGDLKLWKKREKQTQAGKCEGSTEMVFLLPRFLLWLLLGDAMTALPLADLVRKWGRKLVLRFLPLHFLKKLWLGSFIVALGVKMSLHIGTIYYRSFGFEHYVLVYRSNQEFRSDDQ